MSKSDEVLRLLAVDLGKLYWRLNHGDDDELYEIMRKHGFVLSTFAADPVFIEGEPDEVDDFESRYE